MEDPVDKLVASCAIITTAANDLLRPIHDRMPVFLPREMKEYWLDRKVDDPGALGSVLFPFASDAMEAYEDSTLLTQSPTKDTVVVARIESVA